MSPTGFSGRPYSELGKIILKMISHVYIIRKVAQRNYRYAMQIEDLVFVY